MTAKVHGIGGVFFRSPNPAALRDWYRTWLGVEATGEGGAFFTPDAMLPGGGTVWAPFPQATKYFGDSGQHFMINMVVDDVRQALEQVRQGGATVIEKLDEHDYGIFGWFVDPDGNRVELWQPKG
ncbi:MAG: VOC family protein [Gemmatimonadales bacterium]